MGVNEVDEKDRILDRVGNGYRLCIPGDLNGWIEIEREPA